MKIEQPPKVIWDDSIMKDIVSGDFSSFLTISDDKYYYWDEIKHRKDLPYNDPLKAWQMLKINRRLNYQSIEIGN